MILGKHHIVKCWPIYFGALLCRDKRFDVRFNDRDYQVDDLVTFQEWCPVTKEFSGEELTYRALYILAQHDGLKDGFVVLGLDNVPVRPEQWHALPMKLRSRWFGESEYGTKPVSRMLASAMWQHGREAKV